MSLVFNKLEDWYTVEKIGELVADLGNVGFGKSYAMHKVAEKYMINKWPLGIVDPKGIYYAIREKFDELVIIGGPHQDIDFDYIDKILPYLMDNNKQFVLDFSQYSVEMMQELLGDLFRYFIDWHKKNRKPRQYMLEECDYYIGQSGVDGHTKKIIIEAITKGRSDGMGATMISQRFRMIDKTPLGQANSYLLFNMKGDIDLRLVKALTGEDLSMKLKHLDKGRCVIFDGKGETMVYRVGECLSKHPADTPIFGTPQTEVILMPLNAELKKALKL